MVLLYLQSLICHILRVLRLSIIIFKIMKRFFLLVVLSFFSIAYSQPSNNRFDQEDNASGENVMTNTNNNTAGNMQPDGNDGPVDPPAPLPINEYIPLLGFAALILIFYKNYKNRKHV